MKKYIFLLICLLSLCGCDATYNLNIENNRVTESVDFIYEKNDENKEIVNTYFKTDYQAYYDMDNFKDKMYKKTKIDKKDKIGMNLKYVYYNDDYQKSSLLDRCYYKKSFINSDDYIILYTEEGASCFYMDEEKVLDSLIIKITTKLEVEENNADEVKGNTYIWKLTEDNYKDKNINIKIKHGIIKESRLKNLILILIIVILVGIGYIIYKFVNKRSEKVNKF